MKINTKLKKELASPSQSLLPPQKGAHSSAKIAVFALGLQEEDYPHPGMDEEQFHQLSAMFNRDRQERQMRRQQRRDSRRLQRQDNCLSGAEEEDDEQLPTIPGTSQDASKNDEKMPERRRQSSVSVSFNSNVHMEKPLAMAARPRSSADATLVNNFERVTLRTPFKLGPAEIGGSDNTSSPTKRRVKFGPVEVYKFGFVQGLDTVPSAGAVSLGMEEKHHTKHTFQVEEYSKYKIAENRHKYADWLSVSKAMIAAIKQEEEEKQRKRKLEESKAAKGKAKKEKGVGTIAQSQRKRNKFLDKAIEPSASIDSEEHRQGEESEDREVHAEAEMQLQQQFFEQCRVFEPLRRQILTNQGVSIDEDVTRDTLKVVESRGRCGCRCRGGLCRPSKCECAKEGIKCQVDFKDDEGSEHNFPCACSAKSCENPFGRTELDSLRIRNHFLQTLMRIRTLQRKGLDWDDEKHSPQHIRFRDGEDERKQHAQGQKTPSPGVHLKFSRDKQLHAMPSTVSTQLRPGLSQVVCSPAHTPTTSSSVFMAFGSKIQSPDPFVTIRKRAATPPLKTTNEPPVPVRQFIGPDGMYRSMEVQEEPEDEETTAVYTPTTHFPSSPSLLSSGQRRQRHNLEEETPKKRSKRN